MPDRAFIPIETDAMNTLLPDRAFIPIKMDAMNTLLPVRAFISIKMDAMNTLLPDRAFISIENGINLPPILAHRAFTGECPTDKRWCRYEYAIDMQSLWDMLRLNIHIFCPIGHSYQ